MFPLPPFNAIVCPVNTAPLVGNAEVVRVTAIATDTFTIVRTQEGSNPRAIQAGDQIYAAITAKTLTDAEALTPIGSIQMFGGVAAPVNFLLCDGTVYPNATYPGLAAVLGTTYGGDSTHFAVPDLRGRVPMGAGAGSGLTVRARGDKPGVEAYALGVSEMPSHSHGGATGNGTTTTNGDHSHFTVNTQQEVVYAPSWPMAGSGANLSAGAFPYLYPGNVSSPPAPQVSTHTNTTSTVIGGGHAHTAPALSISAQGGGSAHPNIPPCSVVNYIIRAS